MSPVDATIPPSQQQLPTPPLAYAPPPLKLRLRSRAVPKVDDKENNLTPRKRIVKRTPTPSRGVNKRRRSGDDDMGRDDADEDSDPEVEDQSSLWNAGLDDEQPSSEIVPPSTPKRARLAPEQIPLGLERADFHQLHLLEGGAPLDISNQGTDIQVGDDGVEWSAEDDRILVELVLEKLKLTKSEWHDCARNLGKDRLSVGRRWKSLIAHGDVGLKTRTSNRRTRLHSTWR